MDRQLQERLSKKFADMKIDERINLLLMHYADNKNNSRMTDEQTQLIDHLFDGYYPLLFGDELNSTQEYDYRNQVLDIMIEEGIISGYADFGKTATPTAKGHRINEKGGWLKHVKREERDKRLVTTSSIAAIAAAVTTFFIISATGVVAYQDLGIHQKELNMQERVLLQDSLRNIEHKKSTSQYQLLEDTLHKLRNGMDTLNNKVSNIEKKINGL